MASINDASATNGPRPALMRKQSSQSSHSSATRPNPSPGSGGEHLVRQHVKPRHAKVVLPRNHGSARNLVKMARQAQTAQHLATAAAEDGRKQHHRNHSHEHDTEIRLPGSLDESRPAMRRNLTAYQLPRNASHAKLKKNLSHGQLTRLASGKNLVALASAAQQRTPTSPRMKGRSKRPKSAEMTPLEKTLQERELDMEQYQPKHTGAGKSRAEDSRKVGFAVGNESEEEDSPEFEDEEQHEDEWTEESASASPYSTRQNTANNSRRPSVVVDRPAVKSPPAQLDSHAEQQTHVAQQGAPVKGKEKDSASKPAGSEVNRVKFEQAEKTDAHDAAMDVKADAAHRAAQQLRTELAHTPARHSASESDHDSDSASDETGSGSPPSHPTASSTSRLNSTSAPTSSKSSTQAQAPARQNPPSAQPKQQSNPPAGSRQTSAQHAKEHANPATQRFPRQAPVPAVVSNISALDDTHSNRGSPAQSLRSSKSNIGEASGEPDADELVSRFVPSASHPSTVSGANTAANTPKQTSFYGSEHDGAPSLSHPTSPGSTVSSSSGTATPAAIIGRSRTETRLMQQKALAEREDMQKRDLPSLPAWQYDRLNKSLRSCLNLTRLPTKENPKGGLIFPGPEAFQGRFRVINTELRVVQKFRDPIGESMTRLRLVKGSKVQQRALAQKKAGGAGRNTIPAPAAQKANNANVAKSASPPYTSSPLKRAATSSDAKDSLPGNTRQRPKSQLDSARTPPQTRESVDEKQPNEDVIRDLWDQCLEPNENSSFH